MPSMLRATLVLSVICGGMSGAAAQDRAACPGGAPRAFQLPPFALDDRSVAAFMGDDIVVVTIAPAERGPQPRPATFRGAIHRADGTWIDIPAPPHALSSEPTTGYDVRVVGDRVVLLWYGLAHAAAPASGGAIFDRASNAWAPIAGDAPPSIAFHTGPLREVAAGHRWIFWPMLAGQPPDPAPYVLDTRAARWTRGTADGAPSSLAFVHRVLVRGDRVLVPDTRGEVAGVYDAARDRWERTPFPHLAADYVAVVAAPDGGSVAALSWSPAGEAMRLSAWIVDVGARTTRALRAPRERVGRSPNTRHVHYDGASIVYVDALRVHRYARGRWTSAPLRFGAPVTSGGFVRPACGGQMLLQHDRYYLLDVAALAWHPVPWPADAPVTPHRVLFAPDRVAVLGNVYDAVEPMPVCPRGAPCAAPERRRVVDPRAYVIPLR